MKPALVQFIEQQDLDETKTMNLLQDHGICADECVNASDVAEGGKCIAWLSTQNLRTLKKP
jgi:hypothetical protein